MLCAKFVLFSGLLSLLAYLGYLDSGRRLDWDEIGSMMMLVMLIAAMLDSCSDIHCLRDATRGGIATVLNEFAQASDCGIRIDESALPIRPEVRGMCEILGLDPLYLANEGKLLAIVPAAAAPALLQVMRADPGGRDSCIIGEVQPEPSGRVVLNTSFGGDRIVDMLVGEQLPRIC